MKIIHTADWHLCNRLGPVDRTADLRQRVERVAALCEEHNADVLLIAGDLFSEYADLGDITDAFEHILKTFDPFFQRNGTILAVTGNHDRDAKIDMVRAGMTLAMPQALHGGLIRPGRMYLNNGRAVAALADPSGGAVQFVFAPYPFRSRYTLPGGYMSKEEENTLLHGEVAAWLANIAAKPNFDATLPTVLVAHMHVRGAELHTIYKMSAADDVQFDFADLHPHWAYAALGHIHKPQMVNGACHIRYSGSLDRLDKTESHEHGAILFEVGKAGLIGEPIWLPIPSTPWHELTITDLDGELEKLPERFPDAAAAIVEIEVAPHEHAISRDEATRRLRRIFPRLHDLKWLPREGAEQETAPSIDVRRSVAETVRDYLDKRGEFQAEPESERAELLTLLSSFLDGE